MRLLYTIIGLIVIICACAAVQANSRDRFGMIFFAFGIAFTLGAIELCRMISTGAVQW